MRALLALALILLAAPASAATYSLTDAAGDVQCILYDGKAVYKPAGGWTLSARPVPNCVPVVANPPPNPTTISSAAFQARFTQQEQGAIWAAAAKDTTGQIGAGLTQGLTAGTIDLTSPTLQAWMKALVASGALTAARATQVATP